MRSAHATEVRAPVVVFTAALGFSLRGVGDVSGDGVGDFVVASRTSSDFGGTSSGTSFLFYGPLGSDRQVSQADALDNLTEIVTSKLHVIYLIFFVSPSLYFL